MTDIPRRPGATVQQAEPGDLQRISWGAVLAGTLIALMVMLLINLLILGIGLESINPATERNPLDAVGTGTGIGLIVSNLIALFVGGWAAGRLANRPRGGAMHGVLTWGLVTLVTLVLITTALGRVVRGVTSAVGQGLSLAAQGVSAVAPDAAKAVQDALEAQGVSLEDIRQEASQLLAATGDADLQPERLQQQTQQAGEAAQNTAADIAQNPQQAGEELDQLIDQLFAEGQDITDSATQANLVDALVARTDLSQAEAQQTVQNWVQTYQQAQQDVEQAQQALEDAAQATTDALSTAALWAFVGLVLGAIVAALGGLVGRPRNLEDALVG